MTVMFSKSRLLIIGILITVVCGLGMSLIPFSGKVTAEDTQGSLKTFGDPCTYDKTFFGLPVWYEYLQPYQSSSGTEACSFDFSKGKNTTQVTDASAFVLVGLAIADILLRLIGIIAVIFVIVGGVSYVISQGEPDKIKKAQGTIINALIGVAIAIVASGIVAFAGKSLGG